MPAATLAMGALKYVMKRRNAKKEGIATVKVSMTPKKKQRIFLAFLSLITAIALLLSCVLVFAGSKPGMMEDLSLFTLNTSRIGEELHQELDDKINGINLDALHIDLKRRDAPLDAVPSITVPPSTLITLAPRDIKSEFSALTGKVGDGIDSLESAGQSKASEVKSKASSAANSIESGVNSSIDQAAKKLKAKLTELVDEAFRDMVAKLNLKGFYSIHMMTTCEGEYVGKDSQAKKVEICKKHSAFDLVGYITYLYWLAIIFEGAALVLHILAVFKPKAFWIKWTYVCLGVAVVFMLVASLTTAAVAKVASTLTNFLGDGITIKGIAGKKFSSTTWAATGMLAVNWCILFAFNWYHNRHPDGKARLASNASERPLPFNISRPVREEPVEEYNLPDYSAAGPPPPVPGTHGRQPVASSIYTTYTDGRPREDAPPPVPQMPTATFDNRGRL